MDTCTDDPNKSSITKKKLFKLFTNCSFDEKNNVIDYYRGKDCLKRFCQDLRKQAKLIADYEEKEMIELTEEEKYRHHISERCFICKGNLMRIMTIMIIKKATKIILK